MKKRFSKNKKFYTWIERNGPICAAAVFAIIAGYVRYRFSLGEGFNKILDSTVVFASIMVGFIGVLMGVLFSIRDAELIKLFFESRGVRILKRYFRDNIISSILLVILSITMYLREYLLFFDWPVYIGWSCLLAFTLFSAIRIIHIIFHIVFSESDNSEDEEVNMDELNREKIRKQYARKKQ